MCYADIKLYHDILISHNFQMLDIAEHGLSGVICTFAVWQHQRIWNQHRNMKNTRETSPLDTSSFGFGGWLAAEGVCFEAYGEAGLYQYAGCIVTLRSAACITARASTSAHYHYVQWLISITQHSPEFLVLFLYFWLLYEEFLALFSYLGLLLKPKIWK